MSSIQKAHEKLPGSLILLLAASAGFGVAALYYSQPMLGVLGPDIGASARSVLPRRRISCPSSAA